MMRALVSVRDVPEARACVAAGVGLIDLKEPRGGALGGLPTAIIDTVVRAVRDMGCQVPVSATIGDLPMKGLDAIMARVRAVAACGVDYVKVGIERDAGAWAVIDALAGSGLPVVPVFIADRGLDFRLVEFACRGGFPGVMVDTADKRSGTLFDVLEDEVLRRFVRLAVAGAGLVGVAGALRIDQAARLRELAPDFAGFRSAVCSGDRGGSLEPRLVRLLVEKMQAISVFDERA